MKNAFRTALVFFVGLQSSAFAQEGPIANTTFEMNKKFGGPIHLEHVKVISESIGRERFRIANLPHPVDESTLSPIPADDAKRLGEPSRISIMEVARYKRGQLAVPAKGFQKETVEIEKERQLPCLVQALNELSKDVAPSAKLVQSALEYKVVLRPTGCQYVKSEEILAQLQKDQEKARAELAAIQDLTQALEELAQLSDNRAPSGSPSVSEIVKKEVQGPKASPPAAAQEPGASGA